MIPSPTPVKHYRSAGKRFLKPSIQRFLQTQCPKLFGPLLAERLADKLVELVERQLPAKDHLHPGQMVWNAVAQHTRPDSPKVELVPVILTLVAPSDIKQLAQGTRMSTIAQTAIARLCREAQQQRHALPSAAGLGKAACHCLAPQRQPARLRFLCLPQDHYPSQNSRREEGSQDGGPGN